MNNASRKTPFAKKSFGQNFLVDTSYIDRIIDALKPEGKPLVFEIGPGRGALTERLIGLDATVIAIELDRDMIGVLKDRFGSKENFHLIDRDALEVDFASAAAAFDDAGRPAKLVANLPYYISTAILQRLIEQRSALSEMVLMFQREVAQRITASPGTSNRGFLTVMVEAFLEVEKLFDVPPAAFRPVPNVWSSVVRLKPKVAVQTDIDQLRHLASAAFSQKRKTIFNNLKTAVSDANRVLGSAGIDPKRRAETLTRDEWLSLTAAIR